MASPPRASSGPVAGVGGVAPPQKKKKKTQPQLEERPDHGGYRSGQSMAIAGTLAGPADSIIKMDDTDPAAGNGQQTGDMPAIENGQQTAKSRKGNEGLPPGEDSEYASVVDRLPFNLWVAAITFLNIVVLGFEQDYGPSGDNVGMADRMLWYMFECGFCICFLVEICMRIYYSWDTRWDFVCDIWNAIDIFLVLAAVFDAFILVPAGIGGTIRFFTVLRALRVIRLVRLVRMFPAFRELWLLVGGLVNSMKALGWVGMIVLGVLYVCGIVVTTEIGQNHETYGNGPSYDGEIWPYEKYFGSLGGSMFTLFQVITLDGWCDDIVRHVVYRQPLMGLFFVMFLMFTAFGLMNVVVGIIVENTLAAAQVADRRVEERASFERKQAVEQLTDILVKSDNARTGEISLAELRASYQSPIVQEKFNQIGLSMEEIGEIFGLLDYERRGRVELKRFANSCRELVGGAKRRDIAQVEVTVGTLAQHLDSLDSQFSRVEGEVRNIANLAEDFVENTVRVLTGFNGTNGAAKFVPSTRTAQR